MSILRLLSALVFSVCALTAHANNSHTSRSWVEDPTGLMTLDQIKLEQQQPLESKFFSRGYSRSTFWIRLEINPDQFQGLRPEDHLVIRIRPPYLDHLQLFDPLDSSAKQRVTGQSYDWKNDELQSLNLNFVIPLGSEPRDVWLKIRTDKSTFVGGISLTGNITTTNNQLYVGDTVTLTNGTTLRSNQGSIEMITGTHGSVVGINGTLFSFGVGATGLGNSLGNLGGRVSRDQPPANNGIINSIHGIQHAKLNEWVDKSNSYAKESAVEAGDVQIGDLKTVDCEPNLNDNCRIN